MHAIAAELAEELDVEIVGRSGLRLIAQSDRSAQLV